MSICLCFVSKGPIGQDQEPSDLQKLLDERGNQVHDELPSIQQTGATL